MTPQERADKSGQLALKAQEDYRAKFLRIARKEGLTITKIARRLSESLDATEVKVFHDSGPAGEGIVCSDPLVAHRIRLDAVKTAGEYFGIKATEKVDTNVTGTIVFRRAGAEDDSKP